MGEREGEREGGRAGVGEGERYRQPRATRMFEEVVLSNQYDGYIPFINLITMKA